VTAARPAAGLDAAQLAAAARGALLRATAGRPALGAALWLAAAHAAAWGRLPDGALSRLGFRQAPRGLAWHAAPPASTHGRVRAALAAAARAVGLLVRRPMSRLCVVLKIMEPCSVLPRRVPCALTRFQCRQRAALLCWAERQFRPAGSGRQHAGGRVRVRQGFEHTHAVCAGERARAGRRGRGRRRCRCAVRGRAVNCTVGARDWRAPGAGLRGARPRARPRRVRPWRGAAACVPARGGAAPAARRGL